MAKKKRRSKKGMGFAIGMVLYALVALTATGFGMKWLWGYMEAYEATRESIVIRDYMDSISRDKILEDSQWLLEKVDTRLQSREECQRILEEAVAGELSYARKASACTEDTQVYVLRSGKQVIGSFKLQSGTADEYGFRPWYVTHYEFDLSFLLVEQTITATAPEGYPVYVGDVQLDGTFVTEQQRTRFEFLEDFYGEYDLPEFVLNTYEAGPFLGTVPELRVCDPQGNPFTYDDSFDKDSLISYAEEAMTEKLDGFVEEFLDVYVLFSGCANDDRFGNYNKVIQYVVPGSNLAQRMLDALDGMQFAQSRGDKVADITIHHYVKLDDSTYLCDVTYVVNTIGTKGEVSTTNNTRLLIRSREGKLLVESMISY